MGLLSKFNKISFSNEQSVYSSNFKDRFDLFDSIGMFSLLKIMEQSKYSKTNQYTVEDRTSQIHKVKTEQISLQKTVHQVMDSISRHTERPRWTAWHLSAEYFTRIRGGTFVNASGKPVDNWVRVSSARHVPRIRGTQAIYAGAQSSVQVTLELSQNYARWEQCRLESDKLPQVIMIFFTYDENTVPKGTGSC